MELREKKWLLGTSAPLKKQEVYLRKYKNGKILLHDLIILNNTFSFFFVVMV
jgi:hypothetical protein